MKKIERRGFSIVAIGDTAEIFIYGPIGADVFEPDAVTAKEFVDELKLLGDVKALTVRINSVGGSVFDGVAIHNVLLKHEAVVTVEIDAAAFSIASVIAMAGDKIRMASNALFMIHDPSTLAIGTSAEMRSVADIMDKAKVGMISAYQRHFDLSAEKIAALMTEETWFTAEEALAVKAVDEITGENKMAAFAGCAKFGYKHMPKIINESPDRYSVDPASTAAPRRTLDADSGGDLSVVPIDVLRKQLELAAAY